MRVRLLLANFAFMATLRLGLAALTFALFWLLSHRLSNAQLGGFSLLMNVFFMVQALPLLGMNMFHIRRVAADHSQGPHESSNCFYFALPLALLLGFALCAAGSLYRDEGLGVPFALLGLAMIPTAWIVTAECVLVGKEQMRGIASINLLEAVGRLGGAWLATRWGFGLTGVFVVFCAMRFLSAFAYLLNRHLPAPRWRLVQAGTLRGYFSEAPTYLAICVVTGLCARVDIIMLSKLLSLREVGVYSAAARLSDAASMLPTMAAVVVFPAQSRLFETDRAAFARILQPTVRACLTVGFAAALIVIALSPHLVGWLYKPSLAPAAPLLKILILGAALMPLDQLLSTTMLAARAQRFDLRAMTLGLVVLTTLLLVFTHYFGLPGVALATPVALLLRVSYRLTWAQRELAVPLLGSASRVLGAAALAAAVGFMQWGGNAYLDAALALSTYAALLWLTRSIRAADLRSVVQLMAKNRAAPT